MIFGHLADCHLGGWRDPILRDLNHKAFETAVSRCIIERADFVIIAGDLFNTAVPGVDTQRLAFAQLRRLKEAGIPVYFVAGSHDCSPSGKSMLDVIESAGLGVNVSRIEVADGRVRLGSVTDEKTGTIIVGVLGRKGGLDKQYYDALVREPLEQLPSPKIFVFHGSVDELKPAALEHLEAMPLASLPAGFDYYAGGHIHIVRKESAQGYASVVYPGPTFPNNFTELEQLGAGSFCIVRDFVPEFVTITMHPVVRVKVDVHGRNSAEATAAIRSALADARTEGSILLLRVGGQLREGSPADIKFNELLADVRSPVAVLKNTSALTGKDFEAPQVKGTLEEIEQQLIDQQPAPPFGDRRITQELMRVLASSRKEGENIADFEERVIADASAVLDVKE
jgi:DNA repair exonuclease SbcCD nuclease subunit